MWAVPWVLGGQGAIGLTDLQLGGRLELIVVLGGRLELIVMLCV